MVVNSWITVTKIFTYRNKPPPADPGIEKPQPMKIKEEILESLLTDVYGTLGGDITHNQHNELKREFEVSLGLFVQQIKTMREKALDQAKIFKEAKAECSENCSLAMGMAYKISAEVFTGQEE